MDTQYTALANSITALAASHPKPRYLVAVAGAPGSGKTTLATAVAAQINRLGLSPESDGKVKAAVLSMDGFHLPRSSLDALPEEQRKEAYIRRGAPWTFDVKAFGAFMKSLRQWADSSPGEEEGVLTAPTFSHATKDPVPDGVTISNDISIVIVEGNYLLLDEAEWRDISGLVDYRVFVDVDLREARERLARRHVEAGIEPSLDRGFARVDQNDYLNGVLVSEKRVRVDVVVRSEREPDDLRV
ncbi:P-loop containing nucleoside triphosphate hydrolase protein [Aspergillus unguis]